MSNSTSQVGEFCWNELMTPNTNKAKQFYCELFGWKSEVIDMGPMKYTMFKQGDKNVGGMIQTPPGQENHIPPHWMSYINVDNLEKMLDKAKSLGANIITPITPVPNIGRFSIIQDPTGAGVALWEAIKK